MTDDQRFSRVEQVVGADGLAKIRSSTAVVAGVGNIGGPTLEHLASTGMNLILIDRGTVREENLGNQGFTEDCVGFPKVEARKKELLRINPNLHIEAVRAKVEDLGIASFRRANVIFCCLDNKRGRVSLNELAVRNGVAWLDAAVDGSGNRFFGRVAAYDPRFSDCPCYLCPHDRESLREIMLEGAAPGCPTWHWDRQNTAAPATMAISAMGAAIASIQVIWGLKLLTGQGKGFIGRELYLDLDSNVLSVHRIKRNSACLFDHQVFSVRPLHHSVQNATLAETFAVAERSLGQEGSLGLHRRSLVTEIRCPDCSAVRRPYRILQAMTEAEATCECGSVMQPVASALLDRFARQHAVGFLHKTWSEIGLRPHDILSFSNGHQEIHLACEG